MKNRAKQIPVMLIVAFAALLTSGASMAADPSKGRASYQKYCSSCHGADGRGVVANVPDFSRGQGLMAPDTAIASTVRSGSAGMPAFFGIIPNAELLDVVAYLRTLQR